MKATNNNVKSTIIIFLLMYLICCQSYDKYHQLVCQQGNTSQNNKLQQNLYQLWSVLYISIIDKIFFLVACPIVLFIQISVLSTYKRYSQLRVKPGNIFCGLVLIQLGLNLQILSNAIYRTIFSQKDPFPNSYIGFCLSTAIISSFFQLLHFLYLIMFMFYTIFLFRFSLKKKSNTFWTMLHAFVISSAILLTIFFYFEDFMGLNFYGLCGLTITRRLGWNLTLPGVQIMCSMIFAVLGIFTYVYFRKHMPGGEGFRTKKVQQSKIIFMYVTGFSLFQMLMSIMSLLLAMNCLRSQPLVGINIMITFTNMCRILQFLFLIVLIMLNPKFSKKFKQTLKSIFRSQAERSSSQNLLQTIQMEDVLFDQRLLQMKQKSNTIDLLLLSQIYTIISGIYVAYLQYFQNSNKVSKIRGINFRQNISFLLNNKSILSYETQARLLVTLKILPCQIIIHCPKVFHNLLAMQQITNVFESFKIVDNSRKLSNLAEGNGGRSGEFFFFSFDNKYVVKTITYQEFQFYLQNLQQFFNYYQQNPDSLLSKIMGLFTIKGDEMQRTYYLIIMKNILGCQRNQIVRLYDLKGSKYDRQVIFQQAQINQNVKLTLKDIDFINYQQSIKIEQQKKIKLRQILKSDSLFLKNMNLLDYSLLIVRVNWQKPPQNQKFWGKLQRIHHEYKTNQYYHLGVIDYMQKWDFQKKSQKWWKSMIGKKNVSAEQPNKYQLRFMQFIDQITSYSTFQSSFKHQIIRSPIQMKDVRAVTEPAKQKNDQQIEKKKQISKERCNSQQ